jgi:predicted transcriptional regulator
MSVNPPSLQDIQAKMFAKERVLQGIASIFDALSSDCRLEIIYLLLRVDSLPSGEIARLTLCSSSQTSQYLAKMYQVWILKKSRSWKEVSYSLNYDNPFVSRLIAMLSLSFDS